MALPAVRNRRAGLQNSWDPLDRLARRFELSAGAALLPSLRLTKRCQAHEGCVNVLRWSPGGTHLYSGSDDQCLGIWRYSGDTSEPIRLCDKQRTSHRDNIFDVAVDPSAGGRLMALGARDGCVSLHDVVVGGTVSSCDTNEPGADGQLSNNVVYRVLHAEELSSYVAASHNAVILVDPRARQVTKFYEDRGTSPRYHGFTSIAHVPGKPFEYLVACNTGRRDPPLRLFDLRLVVQSGVNAGRPLHLEQKTFPLRSETTLLTGIAFRPDGLELAVATSFEVELFEVPPSITESALKLSATVGWAEGFHNQRTYLKHPVYLGTSGSTFLACGSDSGMAFFWRQGPSGELSGRVLPPANLVSQADSQTLNVVCPHPAFDACPVVACSGIDHNVTILLPHGGKSQFPLHLTEEERDTAFPLKALSDTIPVIDFTTDASLVKQIESGKSAAADAVKAGGLFTSLCETSYVTQCLQYHAARLSRNRPLKSDELAAAERQAAAASPQAASLRSVLVGMGLNAALASGRLGDQSLAFVFADFAATWQPDNPKAWFRRGTAALALKRLDDAASSAAKAQELLGGAGRDAAVDDLVIKVGTVRKAQNEKLKAAMKGMFA